MRLKTFLLFTSFLMISSLQSGRLLRLLFCCQSLPHVAPTVEPDRFSIAPATTPSPTHSDSSFGTRISCDTDQSLLPPTASPLAISLRENRRSVKECHTSLKEKWTNAIRVAAGCKGQADIQRLLDRAVGFIPTRFTQAEDGLRPSSTTGGIVGAEAFYPLPETAFHLAEGAYRKKWCELRLEIAKLRTFIREIRKQITRCVEVNPLIQESTNYFLMLIWYEAALNAYNICLDKAFSLGMGRTQIPLGGHTILEVYPQQTPVVPYLAGPICPDCSRAVSFASFTRYCQNSTCKKDLITPAPEIHMLKAQDLYYLGIAIEICSALNTQLQIRVNEF